MIGANVVTRVYRMTARLVLTVVCWHCAIVNVLLVACAKMCVAILRKFIECYYSKRLSREFNINFILFIYLCSPEP